MIVECTILLLYVELRGDFYLILSVCFLFSSFIARSRLTQQSRTEYYAVEVVGLDAERERERFVDF